MRLLLVVAFISAFAAAQGPREAELPTAEPQCQESTGADGTLWHYSELVLTVLRSLSKR